MIKGRICRSSSKLGRGWSAGRPSATGSAVMSRNPCSCSRHPASRKASSDPSKFSCMASKVGCPAAANANMVWSPVSSDAWKSGVTSTTGVQRHKRPHSKDSSECVRKQFVSCNPRHRSSEETMSRCEPRIPCLKHRSLMSAMFHKRSQALSSGDGLLPSALASAAAERTESSSRITVSKARDKSIPSKYARHQKPQNPSSSTATTPHLRRSSSGVPGTAWPRSAAPIARRKTAKPARSSHCRGLTSSSQGQGEPKRGALCGGRSAVLTRALQHCSNWPCISESP
mmetsp:Transcript_77259/g.185035  ORF Transcript_77259/g.185035 Transcript_77259/m.185035 type:complete len:285 (+) Transcript_77259:332-1186(+)